MLFGRSGKGGEGGGEGGTAGDCSMNGAGGGVRAEADTPFASSFYS